MSAPTTRHLTILLTDIKGFTDKTSHQSRTQIQDLLDKHRELVLPTLEGKGGKLVKTIGDAFLMSFDSPTDAVLAGIAAQAALGGYNKDRAPDDRIEVRIAINAGEVNLVDGDVFGEPVNITARIESIAEAGEVFFTEAVYLAMNKTEVPSAEVGLLQLKGIPEKVRVYKVKRETPVGQNQVHAAAAPAGARPAKAPIFAPGEKAVFAPKETECVITLRMPKLSGRAIALAIDAILCSMLVGMFTPESKTVNFRYDGKSKAKAEAAKTKSVGLSIDDKGISAPGLRIDDKGIRVEGFEEEVFEEGGWRVSNRTKTKSVAFPIVWVFYNTFFLVFLGATPGKKVRKLKVVTMTGEALDWKHAFARSISSLFSGYLLFLGFIWARWEADQRTWHDLIAGTRVTGLEVQ